MYFDIKIQMVKQDKLKIVLFKGLVLFQIKLVCHLSFEKFKF